MVGYIDKLQKQESPLTLQPMSRVVTKVESFLKSKRMDEQASQVDRDFNNIVSKPDDMDDFSKYSLPDLLRVPTPSVSCIF